MSISELARGNWNTIPVFLWRILSSLNSKPMSLFWRVLPWESQDLRVPTHLSSELSRYLEVVGGTLKWVQKAWITSWHELVCKIGGLCILDSISTWALPPFCLRSRCQWSLSLKPFLGLRAHFRSLSGLKNLTWTHFPSKSYLFYRKQ